MTNLIATLAAAMILTPQPARAEPHSYCGVVGAVAYVIAYYTKESSADLVTFTQLLELHMNIEDPDMGVVSSMWEDLRFNGFGAEEYGDFWLRVCEEVTSE